MCGSGAAGAAEAAEGGRAGGCGARRDAGPPGDRSAARDTEPATETAGRADPLRHEDRHAAGPKGELLSPHPGQARAILGTGTSVTAGDLVIDVLMSIVVTSVAMHMFYWVLFYVALGERAFVQAVYLFFICYLFYWFILGGNQSPINNYMKI